MRQGLDTGRNSAIWMLCSMAVRFLPLLLDLVASLVAIEVPLPWWWMIVAAPPLLAFLR
jgi:hypothetical protein